MSEGFSRTLQTADDADGIEALLLRAARDVRSLADTRRLEALAQRYRDYAAALRESVTEDEPAPAPAPEQGALL